MPKEPKTKTGKAAPVVLIHGADEHNVSARAREIVDRLMPPSEQPLGLTIMDGAAGSVAEALSVIGQCVEEIRTSGFLGRKIVWLRNATFLGQDAASKSEHLRNSIDTLASAITAGLPPQHTLVVTAPSVNAKSGLMKACRFAGEVIKFDLQKYQKGENDAVRHARAAFAKHGLLGPENVLDALVERVGTDTRLLDQEIGKLAAFLGDEKNVGHDDLEAVISASRDSTAWTLQDAVGDRHAARAMDALSRLLFKNEAPIGLLMCIETRFRHLLVFREALDKRWVRLSKHTGRGRSHTALVKDNIPERMKQPFTEAISSERGEMHEFVQSKLAGQAERFELEELAACRETIMRTRQAMVSSGTPPALLLKLLIVRLCRVAENDPSINASSGARQLI